MAADDDVTSGVHGFFLFLYHPTYGTGTSTLSLHDALPISEGRSIDVHVQKFEDVALKPASFDLVVSATTFHWLDQRVALAKIGRLLRPGAWLANWWNVFGDSIGVDAFHASTQTIVQRLGHRRAI